MSGPITKVFRRFKERRMFFDALAYHPKWKYRTIKAIADDTGIDEDRVKELMVEYFEKGLVEKQATGEYFALKSRLAQKDPEPPALPNTSSPKLPIPEERDFPGGTYYDLFPGHRPGFQGKSMI